MNGFIHALGHTFDFEGRASRREFAGYYAVQALVALALVLFSYFVVYDGSLDTVIEHLFGYESLPSGVLTTVYYALVGFCVFFIFFPALSLTVRRLHDTNRSGWWLILLGIVMPIAFTTSYCTLMSGLIREGSAHLVDLSPVALWTFSGLGIAVWGLYFYFAYVVFFKAGDRSANRFGNPPRH